MSLARPPPCALVGRLPLGDLAVLEGPPVRQHLLEEPGVPHHHHMPLRLFPEPPGKRRDPDGCPVFVSRLGWAPVLGKVVEAVPPCNERERRGQLGLGPAPVAPGRPPLRVQRAERPPPPAAFVAEDVRCGLDRTLNAQLLQESRPYCA